MENNWSKTILQVYRYLPRLTYAYDKLIETRAFNSGSSTCNNMSFNNVMNVADNIINLSERKVTLINLKLITEKALKNIDRNMARLLILKFIDGKKSVEIAEKFNVCLRTFFRKVKTALDSFTKALNRLGYSEDKLCSMLSKERWINEVYRTFEKENDNNVCENFEFKNQIKSNIIIEFKKISAFN